jgi:hypothetical protein
VREHAGDPLGVLGRNDGVDQLAEMRAAATILIACAMEARQQV